MIPDTIYALATAPGRAGVAVIRVSGSQAIETINKICGMAAPAPRRAYFRKFADPVSRETIDHGLALFFPGPASFTGEDIAEFHLHGGPALIRAMLAALAALPGLRLAEPGEFTRRAFENGKIDLTEAEAIADLVDAETEAQRAQALSQYEGGLKNLYEGWRAALARSLAYVEAEIDFPDEEDVELDYRDRLAADLSPLREAMAAHLADGRRGERLRDGFQVVVIGAPNVGKSSLVNALARRDIAIVSDLAGTTRDIIEAHLDLGGYPVILSDTAGLRPGQLGGEGHDLIESEGIRRAIARARAADLRLLVFDAAAPAPDPQTLLLRDEASLVVFNKSDQAAVSPAFAAEADAVAISARTGAGIDALLARIAAFLREKVESGPAAGMPSLTRQRHRDALEKSLAALDRAVAAPAPEMAAEDLRLAARHLGSITGRVDVEELLDIIFRDFCIGK
jgi:tRNA modification GTPase